MDGLHQYTMAGISNFCPKKHEAFFSSLVWKCKNYYYRDKFRRQKCLIIIGHNLAIPALVSRNIISKIFDLVKLNLGFIQVYKLRDWPFLLYGRINRNNFIRIFSPFSKSKIHSFTVSKIRCSLDGTIDSTGFCTIYLKEFPWANLRFSCSVSLALAYHAWINCLLIVYDEPSCLMAKR